MRSALYNDALRRVVAVAIRRARRVRRGEINLKQRSCEKHQYYFLSLVAIGASLGKNAAIPIFYNHTTPSVFFLEVPGY